MEHGPLDLLVRNAREVVTCSGTHREPIEQALGVIEDGVVGVRAGRVAYVGAEASLPFDAMGPDTQTLDAAGGIVTPGLVDAHTHLVFAGDRSREFELRAQGASYLDIARAGGGIASTVGATRGATESELVALARPRLHRLLEQGVTTVEVKSGYGLDLESELKILRAIERLGRDRSVELIPTLLCAHAVPEEYRARRRDYVQLCVDEIIPAAANQRLARFSDVFCEEGAFTIDESRQILRAAAAHGLHPRLHADQLTSGGGAELAAELGAASADHLEHVSDAGIAALSRAGVRALLVPTSTAFLRVGRYAPGRKLRDAGVDVALGTNVNPGSSMTENVSLVMGLACLENGLSAAEALWGFTRAGALALGLDRHGRLQPGDPADLVVFGCTSWRHLPYHLGVNHARAVLKGGRVVARPTALGTDVCE